jgi:large subunit ribosomal protein L9
MLSVILTKDVENLGQAGELVSVRPGFGRNYLLPKGFALLATRGNIAQLEHHRRTIEQEQKKIRAEQQKIADQLQGTAVSIARKAGKDNKLFGSVTSRDIVEALAMQKIDLDRKLIQLKDPIREVGETEVMVKFNVDIQVALKVTVVGI